MTLERGERVANVALAPHSGLVVDWETKGWVKIRSGVDWLSEVEVYTPTTEYQHNMGSRVHRHRD